MPLSLRNGTALALPSRSWLTVSTLSAAPFCTASASSVGSSATHGAHHVAHRLSSTGVPLKSASVTVLPSGAVKVTVGAASPLWLRSTSPGFTADAPPGATSSGLAATSSGEAWLASAKAPLACSAPGLALSQPPTIRVATRRNGINARKDTSNAMWGGRFAEGPAAVMREINASIPFDKRLWREDIAGSKAHVTMLAAQGVVSAEEIGRAHVGLDAIEAGHAHGPKEQRLNSQ